VPKASSDADLSARTATATAASTFLDLHGPNDACLSPEQEDWVAVKSRAMHCRCLGDAPQNLQWRLMHCRCLGDAPQNLQWRLMRKWQNYALPDERRRIEEQRAQLGLEPWLWGAVVRAPGVGTEVGELPYTAAPQAGGSGGVLGYGMHAQGVPMGDSRAHFPK
jgi:hypothetical protein